MVSAREFKELGIGDPAKELEELSPVDLPPREIQPGLL